MKLGLIFTILAGYLCAAVPQDVAGWTKARWGMTEGQVLVAFPGEAKRLTGDAKDRKFGDRIASVGIESVTIENANFTVYFFFDGRKGLDQVVLAGSDESRKLGWDMPFQAIENALVVKYGQKPHVTTSGTQPERTSAIWTFPSTVIEMMKISWSELPFYALSIVYRARSVSTPRL